MSDGFLRQIHTVEPALPQAIEASACEAWARQLRAAHDAELKRSPQRASAAKPNSIGERP